ncbi:hypothetical protein [Xenorhabdus griffiniae]|uniref:Uncharacterized protein n=2 Tax=Xenorhabdus griffiniae TaxID=351672 RepID=A0ABY9XJ02_9GAMM|nr:hypothetical protein [Xenorhabdus griffiniae]MBD1227219.1 hypothetical protein [Xenorhabdus griffiniae]MBE8586973.1 hypothetical protein [Xenorhabdus griffiniae]WMV72911.1 hypothetical protein QL128_02300 [Xenorhabdus griffiniae]WNH02590.1 hypothetical protein QL112_002305 [Xenorhabdus griffiniae]
MNYLEFLMLELISITNNQIFQVIRLKLANKAVILLNDTTDHGGKVIMAIGGYTYRKNYRTSRKGKALSTTCNLSNRNFNSLAQNEVWD